MDSHEKRLAFCRFLCYNEFAYSYLGSLMKVSKVLFHNNLKGECFIPNFSAKSSSFDFAMKSVYKYI